MSSIRNIIAIVLLLATIINAAPLQSSQSIGQIVFEDGTKLITGCTIPGTLALTFDDGPHIYTEELLDILHKEDVKATFFINGNNFHLIYDYNSTVQRAYREGHQIGSHTWDHADLRNLTKKEILEEMTKLPLLPLYGMVAFAVDVALLNIIGVRPIYMRPPFGYVNGLVRRTLADAGYEMVVWDMNTGDATGSTVAESRAVYDSVLSRCGETKKPGHIALQHDTHESTVQILTPHAIRRAREYGFKLVTVAPVPGPENIAESLIHKRVDSSESVIITKCTQPGTLALTFDDGPYKFTEELLNTLRTNNVKVTFFVNGNNYVKIGDPKYATLIKKAISDGHQIASHTWDHADLATLSKEKILNEMDELNKALKSITGRIPTFMRPPYGSTNALVRETLIEAKYRIVNWDVDTGDSANKSVEESFEMYKEMARSSSTSQAGHIVLQHDVYESTALSLAPKAVELLKNKFRLVTVGTCLGVPEADWYRTEP
ncbi:hypothetical protein EC968_001982 [Mortierella alpina]|nr:hypothetical protein EC968_001982 [Mortierella alpina]